MNAISKVLNKIIRLEDVEPLEQQALEAAKQLGLFLHVNEDDLKNFLRLRLYFLAIDKKPYAEYVNLLSDMKAFGKDFLQNPVRIPAGLNVTIKENRLEVCANGQS